MLNKKYRLTSSSEFRFLYKNGRKFRGESGMLICFDQGDHSPPKFGFVVGKKVGNAVTRHLHTRRLRHLAHENIMKYGERLNGLKFSYISFQFNEDFIKLQSEFNNQIAAALNAFRKE